jgi:hypothetical protein
VNISGDHHFTYRTFRRVVLDAIPMRRLFLRVGAVAFSVLLVVSLVQGEFKSTALSAFILAMPELFALLSWYPQRKQAAQTTHYVLDDEGIRVRTATSDVHLTWAGMAWIKSRPHAWMVRHGAAQLPVPRAAFRPEDRVTIDAFVAGHPAGATK